jgi:hypothetical protein
MFPAAYAADNAFAWTDTQYNLCPHLPPVARGTGFHDIDRSSRVNLESMSTTREVSISRDGRQLEQQSLELLRLPDGATGAKWGGLVFPLHDGDCIDLSDRGFLPGQCRSWTDDRPIWSISTGPEGSDAYLFIEGGAQQLSETVRRLEEAGVSVVRSGPNLSGGLGDWFIRIAVPGEQAVATAQSILEEGKLVASPEEDPNRRERLLVQSLIAAKAVQEQLKAAQDRLREELERARVAAAAMSEDTRESDALRQSLGKMAERLAEVEAEASNLRARIDSEPATVAPAPQPTARLNRLEVDLAEAAASLLPRLDFVSDSMKFVAIELSNRSMLWRALYSLDRQERGQPEGWKSVAGHTGWWERHFSTGQDNQGRLYARLQGQPARWQVLVSHKQDQAGDLRRIGRI